MVEAVTFSPDGRTALTGSSDDTARLWDVATGRELRHFRHANSVSSVAFSPDGRTVLTGSSDGSARLWEAATGRELRQFKGRAVSSVAFSPDGRTALTGSSDYSDNTARLWDVATGRELRQFRGHADSVRSVAFSPDGRTALTGSSDGARLWDLATGRELRQFKGHTNRVLSVAFSPDGRTVLTGSSDDSARLWDTGTGRELRQFKGHTEQVNSVAFSPDGRTALTGSSDTSARLWDVATGDELRQFRGHTGFVGSVTFSPDGRTVLTGGYDKLTRLWDVATGRELRQFKGHTDSIGAVSFSPDGLTALRGSSDTARLWDVATGRELRQFKGHTGSILSVAFSPDGRMVLTGSSDRTAKLWDVATGRELQQYKAHTGSILSVAFSPNGETVVTGSSDNTARLWELATGRELRQFQFKGRTNLVWSVAFSPDGRTVLTGSSDGSARLWEAATGRELRQFKGHTDLILSVAFSPDGRTVLTGSSDGSARLWDTATGRELRQFPGQLNSVSSVAFSPDGRTVLTGGYDTRLWDVATGRELRQFPGQLNSVRSVAFSPDGRKVLTGGYDHTARLWDAVTSAMLVSMLAFDDGEWLTITPQGFFDASSPKAAQNLSIVRGLEVSSVDQVYDALYRPDLVREKLAGDPQGKVRAAASQLDLKKVMASGSAPRVAITSPVAGSTASVDEFPVEATISDQGGGIGKIEWRVNRVTLGVEERGLDRLQEPSAPTPAQVRVTRTLTLEPGENKIEVVAYNAKNLIASEAAQVTVKWDGEKTVSPPKLHVLAVGVNDYWDSRLRLSYAVPDARALAEGLKRAATGLYLAVEVTTVLDADVTISNLDRVFGDLGRKVQPRDVFVFFLAGHGKTKNGRYYFIPRDFRYEDEDSIEKTGVDQNRFQAWFSRIAARKSILLYDTCESGSLTGSRATRGDIDERLGALNRMTRATGRTFLVATTDDAPALEGYRGHGLFTYVLLDALNAADTNGNGLIEVSELADYVDAKVPEVSYEAFRLRQIPQRNMMGNNFALVGKATVLPTGSADSYSADKRAIPAKSTHVVIKPVTVRQTADPLAPIITELQAGIQVALVETVQGWMLVARDGKQVGYVEESALARLH